MSWRLQRLKRVGVEEKRHDAYEGYAGGCDARSTGAKNTALVCGGDFVEVKHGG